MNDNRQRSAYTIVFALAMSATLVGCNPSAEKPGGIAVPVKSSVPIAAVKPEWASLPRTVEQPGTILAYEETQLFARVTGYIRLPRDPEGRILSDIGRKIRGPGFDKDGKQVEPGEVLAEVAVPELEEDVKQKNSLVRQAEAGVDQARKALASADANISVAEAAVLEAKALFERWDSESKRIATLAKNGVLDAQVRDEAQYQFKAAGARVISTEAAVRKAKADRDKSAADVTAAQAKVDVGKAEAGRADTMLGYAKIRAPYDGVIVARRGNTGELVQTTGPKGEWLFTVARLDPVRVVVSVPETDAGRIDLETAEVTLNVPALMGPGLSGPIKLTRTAWALDPTTRTLRTEIDLSNKDGRLRPGMYVYAKIASPSPKCWALPVSAIVKQGETAICYQIDDQGKALRRVVQVGRRSGNLIEIMRWQTLTDPSQWEDFPGSGTFANPANGLKDGQPIQQRQGQNE